MRRLYRTTDPGGTGEDLVPHPGVSPGLVLHNMPGRARGQDDARCGERRYGLDGRSSQPSSRMRPLCSATRTSWAELCTFSLLIRLFRCHSTVLMLSDSAEAT